jgi:predicted esterase
MEGAGMNASIHQGQPVVTRGTPLDKASAAMLAIHGRGGGAMSIMSLASHLSVDGFAYLAPEAAGGIWYPQRFLVPRAANQPYLDSALETMSSLLREIEAAGIPPEKTLLLGFSQGACLALETAARFPARYGGVIAFSGGLIGADNELNGYTGSLAGTPIFLGCSDIDDHIPVERVHTSTEILTNLGADVTERIYPRMGHTVNMDEIEFARAMMAALL